MRKDISDEELFRKWDEEADILEERCLAADRNDWGAMMECWDEPEVVESPPKRLLSDSGDEEK